MSGSSPEPSDGELLLNSFHGRCGHRRQGTLPCATPDCDEGGNLHMHGYARVEVPFGDERHYVWRKVGR